MTAKLISGAALLVCCSLIGCVNYETDQSLGGWYPEKGVGLLAGGIEGNSFNCHLNVDANRYHSPILIDSLCYLTDFQNHRYRLEFVAQTNPTFERWTPKPPNGEPAGLSARFNVHAFGPQPEELPLNFVRKKYVLHVAFRDGGNLINTECTLQHITLRGSYLGPYMHFSSITQKAVDARRMFSTASVSSGLRNIQMALMQRLSSARSVTIGSGQDCSTSSNVRFAFFAGASFRHAAGDRSASSCPCRADLVIATFIASTLSLSNCPV